jgi:hypothetical protein
MAGVVVTGSHCTAATSTPAEGVSAAGFSDLQVVLPFDPFVSVCGIL